MRRHWIQHDVDGLERIREVRRGAASQNCQANSVPNSRPAEATNKRQRVINLAPFKTIIYWKIKTRNVGAPNRMAALLGGRLPLGPPLERRHFATETVAALPQWIKFKRGLKFRLSRLPAF